MSEKEVFAHRSSAGGCLAVPVLLGIFPLLFVGTLLPESYRPFVSGLVGLVVVVAIALWVGIRREHRLVVDAGTLVLTSQELRFGVPGPVTLVWELPRAELDGVVEVHTQSRDDRGGFRHAYALHFPGHRVLREDMLGTRAPTTEYGRLAAWLRGQLGERFTTQDQG